MVIGPVAHYHENSKYYSAIKPRPSKCVFLHPFYRLFFPIMPKLTAKCREVDENLPHVTIQMPVYKESLESVL